MRSKAGVSIANLLSTLFPLGCGVREGAILSPILFAVFIDDLVADLRAAGVGAHLASLIISSLLFADGHSGLWRLCG